MSLSVIWPTAGVQHADLHFLVRQLQHGGLDRLGAALHVGLDQDRDFLLLAGLDAGQHLIQRAARAGRARRRSCRAACGVRNSVISRARPSFSTTTNGSPADRHAGQAEDLDRRGRAGVGDRLALVVQHRAHPAPFGAGHHDVALLQRAASAPASSPTGPRPRSSRLSITEPSAGALRIGPQVEDFGLQQDRLFQLVEAGLLHRRDFDVLRLAAHFLDHDLVAQQFLAHPRRDWRPACPSC